MPATKAQEVVVSLKMKDDVVREQLADLIRFVRRFRECLDALDDLCLRTRKKIENANEKLNELVKYADKVEDWFEIKTEAKE